MSAESNKYELFDLPEVTNFLFHPRSESGYESDVKRFQELYIPVGDEVKIGGRFYASGRRAPVLLFFHGNGEIVADYDDIGQFYQRMNINFVPVDYRGYGTSSGSPSVTTMMKDCTAVFDYVVDYLKTNGYEGAMIVMGRSLGSASALELATYRNDLIDGLILESGFAHALPLLELLGIEVNKLGLSNDSFGNAQKIARFQKSTLIIHAELDHIIPFSDGEHLYQQSGAADKKLVKIAGANHNDLLARGLEPYMQAVKHLIEGCVKRHAGKAVSKD